MVAGRRSAPAVWVVTGSPPESFKGEGMSANVVEAGRFNLRVCRPGSLLYSGQSHTFDRPPRPWEAQHTLIEVYDSRYPHTSIGQFVSSYLAETLAGKTPVRLSLQGDVPDWTMTVEETAILVALARREAKV